ncbi:MAG: hypothetical protein ABI370_13115 [Gammaproteobacteria bacterium]
MMLMKKLFTIFGVFICIFALFGCATTYDRGNGVVITAKKIQQRDFKPHERTKTGAEIGGVTGAIGGAAAGGFVGLALGAFGNVAAPVLIATTLGGAVVGAVIVGGAGAAAGAGLGYVVDIGNHNAGLYQFIVKPDSNEKPITVTQYSSIIPIDSRVHILEKDDNLFIKPLSTSGLAL